MVSFLPNFLYPVILGNLQGYPENAIAQILFIRGLGLLVGFCARRLYRPAVSSVYPGTWVFYVPVRPGCKGCFSP